MKAEHLIAHYLIMHGSISLQELGIFSYNGSPVNMDDLNQSVTFPENSVFFQYNPKSITEDAFIQFVTKHSGKLRSLVASDFESYLLTGKQFLNIGKPLVLKDMGVLIKQQNGTFEFTQGIPKHEAIDTNHPGDKNQALQKAEAVKTEGDISFSAPAPKRQLANQKKWITGGIIILLILAGVVTGIYNYNKNEKPDIGLNQNLPKADSVTILTDTVPPSTLIDTTGFDLILKTLSKNQEVQSWFKKWEKYQLPFQVDSTDTAFNLIYLHYELPYRDTTSQLDSMKSKKIPVSAVRLN